MNTKITLTANGNMAPNQVIDLGIKYESVGDTLTFNIPEAYVPYHHYLVFYMKRKETILLPVNNLVFTITTTITRNPGTYEMIFVATEDKVIDGDINGARKVFVSSTMLGTVQDSFLKDPVTTEELDPNLQIVYDSLLDLRSDLQTKLENDYWRGAAYVPDVDSEGNISWSRTDGQNIMIPETQNIRGPQGQQGPFYTPAEKSDEPGVLQFSPSQEGMAPVADVDFNPLIEQASANYLQENLRPTVNEEMNKKFRWIWDSKKKEFYIFADSDSSNVQTDFVLDKLRDEFAEVGKKYVDQEVDKVIQEVQELEEKVDLISHQGFSWIVIE